MARHSIHGWLKTLPRTFQGAIAAALLIGVLAESDLGAEPKAAASASVPTLESLVSLNGEQMTRSAALDDVCRQAGIALKIDTEAVTAAGLKLDELISVELADESLQDAVGRIIEWRAHWGIYREIRDGVLHLTTIEATQKRTLQCLPDWLKPFYSHGLAATIDESRNVVTVIVGQILTDELLAKLGTLPKVRELQIEVTKGLTPAGLARLSEFAALEKLTLYGVNREGAGLGDDILQSVRGLKSLRSLSINECGTTDAGAGFLEDMQQLTHLAVHAEGRLTDAALASIAKMKGLRRLDLPVGIATVYYGPMRFTPAGLRQLAALRDLESLNLAGQAPPADLFPLPKLTSLGVGAVDDEAATRIAQCRNLETLLLMDAEISDEGLRQIATLDRLRRLRLVGSVIADAGTAHLKALSQLEYVELSAPNVGDETLKHLAEITTLTGLTLHGPDRGKGFSIEGLSQLKNLPELRGLCLVNLAPSGGLDGLRELTQLRQLTLMSPDISEGEIDALQEALPKTKIVNWSSGEMTVRHPR